MLTLLNWYKLSLRSHFCILALLHFSLHNCIHFQSLHFSCLTNWIKLPVVWEIEISDRAQLFARILDPLAVFLHQRAINLSALHWFSKYRLHSRTKHSSIIVSPQSYCSISPWIPFKYEFMEFNAFLIFPIARMFGSYRNGVDVMKCKKYGASRNWILVRPGMFCVKYPGIEYLMVINVTNSCSNQRNCLSPWVCAPIYVDMHMHLNVMDHEYEKTLCDYLEINSLTFTNS